MAGNERGKATPSNLQDAILDREHLFKPGWGTGVARLPDNPELCAVGMARQLLDGRTLFCTMDNIVIIYGPTNEVLFYTQECNSVEEVDEALGRTKT